MPDSHLADRGWIASERTHSDAFPWPKGFTAARLQPPNCLPPARLERDRHAADAELDTSSCALRTMSSSQRSLMSPRNLSLAAVCFQSTALAIVYVPSAHELGVARADVRSACMCRRRTSVLASPSTRLRALC